MAKNTTQSTTTPIAVGSKVRLPSGTRIKYFGARRKVNTREVTVREVETDKRSGKTRIYWKSNGYEASALI